MSYRISNETPAIKKEIEIRGRYLMMACHVEYCLLNIIMFCNPDPNNHERVGQFKEMRMAAKINNVIADLKRYKPNYYTEFKKVLDGLEEFRKVRNHMSHCTGDFPYEPDLSIFRITYVDKDEIGIEGMKFTEYTDEFISKTINEFATINGNLSILWNRLSNEFASENNPFVHPSHR
jgi:hypothetical protein